MVVEIKDSVSKKTFAIIQPCKLVKFIFDEDCIKDQI